MPDSRRKTRIVAWGTYDLGKPRVRLLLAGARARGFEVIECHADIWSWTEDKSQAGLWKLGSRGGIPWLLAQPRLIWKYLRLPRHDVVLVPYLGLLDVLVISFFARIRNSKVVWDPFHSLYDTLVRERRLMSARSPLSWILYALEWLACRMSDTVFVDTQVHARYFESLFGLARGKVRSVLVGAETEWFGFRPGRRRRGSTERPFSILFYGQFAPLHGVETVVEAAHQLEKEGHDVRWIIIGTGQEKARVDQLIERMGIQSIRRLDWIPYRQLGEWLQKADVGLGIFGKTGKAGRVVPNKVFQILTARRPLITADTPAVREILGERQEGVCLVPSADSRALAEAVKANPHRRDNASRGIFPPKGG